MTVTENNLAMTIAVLADCLSGLAGKYELTDREDMMVAAALAAAGSALIALGVAKPGDDLSEVIYTLLERHQHQHKDRPS